MEKQTIVIGSDHGGFEQKEAIKAWLSLENYQVIDVGAHELDPMDDYPEVAFAVANQVVTLEKELKSESQKLEKTSLSRVIGIITCRSAGGVTIAANKVSGARSVAVFDQKSAIHAREHNNANIITLSGDWLEIEQAKELIKIFLHTEFTGKERHVRRIAQISEYEKNN